jgi:hypothetical protein
MNGQIIVSGLALIVSIGSFSFAWAASVRLDGLRRSRPRAIGDWIGE